MGIQDSDRFAATGLRRRIRGQSDYHRGRAVPQLIHNSRNQLPAGSDSLHSEAPFRAALCLPPKQQGKRSKARAICSYRLPQEPTADSVGQVSRSSRHRHATDFAGTIQHPNSEPLLHG